MSQDLPPLLRINTYSLWEELSKPASHPFNVFKTNNPAPRGNTQPNGHSAPLRNAPVNVPEAAFPDIGEAEDVPPGNPRAQDTRDNPDAAPIAKKEKLGLLFRLVDFLTQGGYAARKRALLVDQQTMRLLACLNPPSGENFDLDGIDKAIEHIRQLTKDYTGEEEKLTLGKIISIRVLAHLEKMPDDQKFILLDRFQRLHEYVKTQDHHPLSSDQNRDILGFMQLNIAVGLPEGAGVAQDLIRRMAIREAVDNLSDQAKQHEKVQALLTTYGPIEATLCRYSQPELQSFYAAKLGEAGVPKHRHNSLKTTINDLFNTWRGECNEAYDALFSTWEELELERDTYSPAHGTTIQQLLKLSDLSAKLNLKNSTSNDKLLNYKNDEYTQLIKEVKRTLVKDLASTLAHRLESSFKQNAVTGLLQTLNELDKILPTTTSLTDDHRAANKLRKDIIWRVVQKMDDNTLQTLATNLKFYGVDGIRNAMGQISKDLAPDDNGHGRYTEQYHALRARQFELKLLSAAIKDTMTQRDLRIPQTTTNKLLSKSYYLNVIGNGMGLVFEPKNGKNLSLSNYKIMDRSSRKPRTQQPEFSELRDTEKSLKIPGGQVASSFQDHVKTALQTEIDAFRKRNPSCSPLQVAKLLEKQFVPTLLASIAEHPESNAFKLSDGSSAYLTDYAKPNSKLRIETETNPLTLSGHTSIRPKTLIYDNPNDPRTIKHLNPEYTQGVQLFSWEITIDDTFKVKFEKLTQHETFLEATAKLTESQGEPLKLSDEQFEAAVG